MQSRLGSSLENKRILPVKLPRKLHYIKCLSTKAFTLELNYRIEWEITEFRIRLKLQRAELLRTSGCSTRRAQGINDEERIHHRKDKRVDK
ncbi:hypothetical protein WA026_014526 [Henosepilachna vigintioctopunctata]|uniref:Uncharacterized protein n=1 Tax=Henosepilachna vigintioctopunctata TaxID=420089 RepID=A0AAW1UKZ8_9CUCU